MLLPIGKFKCASGELVATDPCNKEPQRTFTVKKGLYNVVVDNKAVKDMGYRNHALYIFHESDIQEPYKAKDLGKWDPKIYSVAVDSGEFCFCDTDTYQRGEIIVPGGDETVWFDSLNGCIDASDHGADVMLGGCGCLSGMGDGLYVCQVRKDPQGEISALKIVFIE